MKRHLSILACLLVVFAMVLSFASCDLIWPEHTHDYVDGKCECGESDPNYVPPHTHNFVDGVCECGEKDPDYVKPECTEHAYSVEVTKEATCTEEGEKTLTCTVCGATDTQAIAPNGHTEETVAGTAPTCTEPGLSSGKKCSVCNDVLTAQVEIPKTGHNFVEGTCDGCGEVDPEYNGPKTYVFESTTMTQFAAGEKADGDTELVGTNGFFKLIYSAKTKVDTTSNKEWEDGYAIGADKVSRLAWAASSYVNDEKNGTKNVVEITVTDPTVVKVWWICGGDNRQVAIYNADGSIHSQTNIESVKNSPYLSEFSIEEAGTYYIGNIDGANYYIKLEAVVTPAEEAPANEIEVTTTDTYGYFDLYSFTADKTGYYTFTVPAGLGWYSKSAYDAWGNAEIDFGGSFEEKLTIQFSEGEVYEFYVGAFTKQDWVITWTYSEEAPPEPTVIDLVDGDNDFTIQEIDFANGVTAYLNVYQTALYTLSGEGLYISVYNSYGMLVTKGYESVSLTLEGSNWGAEYTIMLGADVVGDYTINVSYVAPTILEDGENTVTVDADGADCVYYPENAGNYFFNVTGATVTVSGLTANEDGSYTLDSYVSYDIVVTAETEGDYTVTVVAPIFLSQYDENTVTVDADGVVVFFETSDKGHYTISGEGLTIVVTDAEGNVVEAGALLPSYTVYTVTITAAEAGDYAIDVNFTAPVGAMDNPEKIESLPATLTPDLSSVYSNYYYQFTASANGHVTLSYTASGEIGSVAVGDNYIETGATTGTFAVVAGQTYKVYFSCGDPVTVQASLSFEADVITENEWKEMITYTTIEFANGSDVTITQAWDTGDYYVYHYQYDADWNMIFQANYSYTVTVNEDGSLTLTLTYIEDHENNSGTPAAIGNIKVELVDGNWVASCVHNYVDYTCSICGDLYLEGAFASAMPDTLTYITNNSSYPDPSFYSNGGIKFNYVNQGLQTDSFAAQSFVSVTLNILALNSNTKTEVEGVDAFTFYALNAAGETVATATLNTLATGDNTVELSGEGIVAVKVVMTDYYNDGSKCYNVSIGGLSVD